MTMYVMYTEIAGLETVIKVVDKEVYNWITKEYHKDAKIDLIDMSLYYKFLKKNEHMDSFVGTTNKIKVTPHYLQTKFDIAPAVATGFDSVKEAKDFIENEGCIFGGVKQIKAY